MKIHKIPLVGIIFAILAGVLSVWRFWFLYYDPSQLIIFAYICASIVGFSYIYNILKIRGEENEKRYEEIVKMIDSFLAFKLKMEEEDEKNHNN